MGSAAAVATNQLEASNQLTADSLTSDPLVETAISEATADANVDVAPPGEQTWEYTILMTCSGCSGAIDRTLKRLVGEGVVSYNVSLEKNTATVTLDKTFLTFEDLTEKLRKTGKKILKAENKGTGDVTEFSS